MSQSSYFKSRTDMLTLGGTGLRGEPEILENAYKCRSYVIDVTGIRSLWGS